MKNRIISFLKDLPIWIFLLVGIFACFETFAQVPIGLSDINAAAEGPPEDQSLRMFKGIFGEQFASSNPFSAVGTPQTLVGDIFFIFNSIVFVLGSAFTGYLIVMSIAQSAQDGEPVGKNASMLWAPIRIGVGIFGMLPVIGGFSVFQAITMSAIVLGIGAGNMTASKLIESAADFKAITPSFSAASSAPNISSDVEQFVRGAILAELCFQGERYNSALNNFPVQPPVFIKDNNTIGFDYGKCGTLSVERRTIGEAREDSVYGFRLNSVNYSAIAQAVQSAAESELKTVQREAATIAAEYMSQNFKNGLQTQVGAPIAPVRERAKALETQVRTRLSSAIADSTSVNESAISDSLFQTIKQGGWTEIGSFYSVFAEVSAAVADAQRAFELRYKPGILVESAANDERSRSAAMMALKDYLQLERYKKPPEDERGLFQKLVDYVDTGITNTADAIAPENAVGHRSLGQNIVNKLTGAASMDSGGAGLVNPVIAAKNLGDYMMIIGQTGLGATFASSIVPAGRGVKIASDFVPALEALGGLLTTALYFMIGIGMFLSLFVPMIFFMTWATAIATYIITMLQAIVFGQFSAFSHIKMEGEGIAQGGSSAAKFYVYLLNALFRPALMVMGFALASAALTIFGTWFVNQFAAAMGAAQGNSMTGVLSAIGFCAIFAVMLFGSVQIFANLITELPDKMLGWIGSHAENGNSMIIGAAVGAALRNARGPASIGAGAVKAVAGGGR